MHYYKEVHSRILGLLVVHVAKGTPYNVRHKAPTTKLQNG
jgi:hypothetical protein